MAGKKVKPIGFMSEHTASYALIPAFTSLLNRHFEKIIPIYYWASREGIFKNFENKMCRVVALFPRRPKINLAQPDQITVKLSKTLYDYSNVLTPSGVAVFAGCPIVTEITELAENRDFAWFRIEASGNELEVRLNLPFQAEQPLCLSKKEILAYIFETSKIITFQELAILFKNAKQNSYHHFSFGNFYKPVYFLLPI